jgi:hypothetical protein
MLKKVPLTFLNFEFHELHYNDTKFYSAQSIEEKFQEAVASNQSALLAANKDRCLSISQWTSSKQPPKPTSDVLLQIFQVMPLTIDCQCQNNNLILHEFVVKPWYCSSDSFLDQSSKSRHCLSRLPSIKLYLILDRPITHQVLNLHKKGHLCLSLSLKSMDDLAFTSEKLIEQLQHMMELDFTVQTGLTFQNAIQNCKDFQKSTLIRTAVFGEVDLCFVSIGAESMHPSLANTNLILSSDLQLLFSPGTA